MLNSSRRIEIIIIHIDNNIPKRQFMTQISLPTNRHLWAQSVVGDAQTQACQRRYIGLQLSWVINDDPLKQISRIWLRLNTPLQKRLELIAIMGNRTNCHGWLILHPASEQLELMIIKTWLPDQPSLNYQQPSTEKRESSTHHQHQMLQNQIHSQLKYWPHKDHAPAPLNPYQHWHGFSTWAP